MGITGVTIWVIGVINLLTKSPLPPKYPLKPKPYVKPKPPQPSMLTPTLEPKAQFKDFSPREVDRLRGYIIGVI